jgi:plasmid maintenance system killer protein
VRISLTTINTLVRELLQEAFKGLRHLHEDGNAKGSAALETAETLEQLGRFPGWKLHPLKGDLKGLWSLTVTGNWRLIFRYDEQTNTASDIGLIDYHQGDLIRTEILEALGLNVLKAAEILQVRRATLSDLLHGKAALTPEMALHRKGIWPGHAPPSPHATRLRRGENAGARAGYLDQTVRPGVKAGQGIGELGQVVPAYTVRGPRYCVSKASTPVLSSEEAAVLLATCPPCRLLENGGQIHLEPGQQGRDENIALDRGLSLQPLVPPDPARFRIGYPDFAGAVFEILGELALDRLRGVGAGDYFYGNQGSILEIAVRIGALDLFPQHKAHIRLQPFAAAGSQTEPGFDEDQESALDGILP